MFLSILHGYHDDERSTRFTGEPLTLLDVIGALSIHTPSDARWRLSREGTGICIEFDGSSIADDHSDEEVAKVRTASWAAAKAACDMLS